MLTTRFEIIDTAPKKKKLGKSAQKVLNIVYMFVEVDSYQQSRISSQIIRFSPAPHFTSQANLACRVVVM